MRKYSRYLPLAVLIFLPFVLFGLIKVTSERKERNTIEALIANGEVIYEQYQHVVASNLNIQITPLTTILRPSQSPDYQDFSSKQRTILALPVQVVNQSRQTLSFKIDKEWHGGEWPSTDLHVFMTDDKPFLHPVFLVREKGARNETTVLRPGEAIDLALRMDWPGTGSVRGRTLMSADKSGPYNLRVVLFFESEGQQQYVISPKMRINVVAQEDP